VLADSLLDEFGQAHPLLLRLCLGPAVDLVIDPQRSVHDRNLSQSPRLAKRPWQVTITRGRYGDLEVRVERAQ
jgi:hypothetical protein